VTPLTCLADRMLRYLRFRSKFMILEWPCPWRVTGSIRYFPSPSGWLSNNLDGTKECLLRHFGMKIVYLVSLIISALFAFLVLEDLDKEPTLGETAALWIVENRGSSSGAEATRIIASFARDHRVSIVRKVHDIRNPDGLLHLYIAAGNPHSAPASWLDQGFSSFGRTVRTETHTFEEIGFPDLRGMYHVYGPPDAIESVRKEFGRLGLTGRLILPSGLAKWIIYYALSPLGRAYFVVAASMVLTVGASVILSSKGYGVLRLQGMSFLAILQRDLRRLVPFWLAAFVSTTAITLIVLGLYNGFARLELFAAVAAGLAGALSLVALCAHIGALILVTRGDILQGLKGKVAPGPALATAYLVRIAAALLVLVIGGATLVSLGDVLRREASQKSFAPLGEATYIALSGSRTPEAAEEMSQQVGRWLRRADQRGQVIIAFRLPMEWFGRPGTKAPESDLLVVNDTYLDTQPILAPSGARYGPDPRERVRVIVPESQRKHAGAIIQSLPEVINPGDGGKQVRQTGVDHMWAKDGQTVFAFSSGNKGEKLDRSLIHDPVIISIPNGSPLIPDGNYTAMATMQGIIFKDPQDVLAAIGRDVSVGHISEINSIRQQAAEEHAQAVYKLRLSIFSLVAALVVLFVTGIAVCVIYARKNAQAIFAKHISGWSFLGIHRWVFILDTLVAAGLLAWVGWDVWIRFTQLNEFAALGVPPPPGLLPPNIWEFAPAVGVAALAAAMLGVALGTAHRRIIREHATEA
jgi:hypothetical protein